LDSLDDSWLEGINAEAALAELRRHGSRSGRVPATGHRVGLVGSSLVIEPEGLPASPGLLAAMSFKAGASLVHLSVEKPPQTLPVVLSPEARRPLLDLAHAVPFTLESDRERVVFKAIPRPDWARRMWYDASGVAALAKVGDEEHKLIWRLAGQSPVPERDGGSLQEIGHWHANSRPSWASHLWADERGLAAEFEISGVRFVLRWIPPGRFLMGSPEDERGRNSDEGPRHEVTISRGFWMGETPVTQAQWRAVVEAARADAPLWKKLFKNDALKPDPSHFKGPGELPVEQVSWDDSSAFCRLLDAVLPDGPGFRLPTEAQWEYACRAGTESALYTGGITIEGENNAPELDPIAWYGGNSGLDLEVSNPYNSADWPEKQHDHKKAGTHRVKLKGANPFGLYDTLGNVWEWCLDGRRDFTEQAQIDPVGPQEEGANRVVRGGSWISNARLCRAACRFRIGPGYRSDYLGLRLAAGQELKSAEPQGAERPQGAEGRSRGRKPSA
jgi:formylglycine-generating enzyme required for sulfatase activity